MTRVAAILCILVLAACTPRAQIELIDASAASETVVPVYVATSRALDSAQNFGTERSPLTSYARYDISIPTDRTLGSLSWPGRQSPDPAQHFVASGAARYADSAAFQSELRRALAGRPPQSREVVIYVHGYNNNFADGVLRVSQLAHDLELPGVAVHYSWPSAANPLGYVYDRDSALFARDGLETLIQDIEKSGASRIIIAAHSMGSLVTMETLRQIAIAKPGSVDDRISGVILVSPDLDIDVFRGQAERIGDLPRTFGIFVSKRDRALALSARLTGTRERLGNVGSVQAVSDLDVTIIDVTEFSSGLGHSTAGTSPTLLQLFDQAGVLDKAFRNDAAGQAGLVPGTVLTVQNATSIILSPVRDLSQAIVQ